MVLTVYAYSNKGGRERNEDSLKTYVSGDTGVFILADGLGGHKSGEIASAIAANALTEGIKKLERPGANGLREAFLAANAAIIEKRSEPGCKSMKTTAVALFIRSDEAIWGHVGDSRLYYFADGEIEAVTKDHSVTYKKYLGGEISYMDIRNDEDRSSLLGVLGNSEKCVPEVMETPRAIKAGDAFLLCSDGFWEYVYDEEMLIDLLKSDTPKEWADFMLLRHIRRAKPSCDNFSVIAVRVE